MLVAARCVWGTMVLGALVQPTTSCHTGFDPREATIASVHNALFSGASSCRDIVISFVARIEALKQNINAIITLTESSLERADELDYRLSIGNVTGPLFCVPILLKDNFDTYDSPTTGGCRAFADSWPSKDAPAVAALRAAGAIILGKTNLHEMALEGLSVSSLGGQTLNPYDHTRTPGGSSGGSAAAVAASFAVLATGTDTVNSLRNPASANSLFSIRPTRGLITRAGVIPVSNTQDTVGVIAREIRDLAVTLTALAGIGHDVCDEVTNIKPLTINQKDYEAKLHVIPPQQLRLGVLTTFLNRTKSEETTPVNEAFDELVEALQMAGATMVPISDPIFNATEILATLDTQKYEYRQALDNYLQRSNLTSRHPVSFDELYWGKAGGKRGEFLVIPSQRNFIQNARVSSSANASYADVQAGIHHLTSTLHYTMTAKRLDAILYPQQQNLVVKLGSPSQSGRNGILAALTGSPVLTVPLGFSNASFSAPIGLPIGMEILGLPWSEQKLLNIALTVENLHPVRRPPLWAMEMIEAGNLTSLPRIAPNVSNIPSEYPIGVL